MKSLREYFSVNDRQVVNVKPGPAIIPSQKWKNIQDVGLTKSFEFQKRSNRDHFIMQCIATETHQAKQDIVWTIDNNVVSVLIKVTSVGLTEPIIEFAKTLDSIYKEHLIDDKKEEYAY